MNERIKELRKSLGLSQDEFGRRLGVTRGAITNIELNKLAPKPLMVDLICREFNVSKEWIQTGNGPMFNQMSRDEEIAAFMGEIMRDEKADFRRRFIAALSKMTTEEWEVLESAVIRLAEEMKKADPD